MQVPHDFDWIFYVNYYPELTNLTTENAAKQHYVEKGKKEHRYYNIQSIRKMLEISMPDKYSIKMPVDFDWLFYIKYNSDLRYLITKENAIKHYTTIGHLENLPYCIKNIINSIKYIKNTGYQDFIKSINNKESTYYSVFVSTVPKEQTEKEIYKLCVTDNLLCINENLYIFNMLLIKYILEIKNKFNDIKSVINEAYKNYKNQLNNKTVLLISGLPKSGKSTLTKSLKNRDNLILATDAYVYYNMSLWCKSVSDLDAIEKCIKLIDTLIPSSKINFYQNLKEIIRDIISKNSRMHLDVIYKDIREKYSAKFINSLIDILKSAPETLLIVEGYILLDPTFKAELFKSLNQNNFRVWETTNHL